MARLTEDNMDDVATELKSALIKEFKISSLWVTAQGVTGFKIQDHGDGTPLDSKHIKFAEKFLHKTLPTKKGTYLEQHVVEALPKFTVRL